jgi:hypothetical protein
MIDDFGPDFDEEGNPLEEGESDRVTRREGREAEDMVAPAQQEAEEPEEAGAAA